jgi:PadR family transcriptional regulator PadR
MYISMPSYEKMEKSIPPSLRGMFSGLCSPKGKSSGKFLKKVALTFIVWLIDRKPMSGYELMKLLEKEHHGPSAKPSRIYPFLAYMEGEGLLKSRILKKGMRESKQYSVTPKGKLVLRTTKKLLSGMLWGEFLREMSKKG